MEGEPFLEEREIQWCTPRSEVCPLLAPSSTQDLEASSFQGVEPSGLAKDEAKEAEEFVSDLKRLLAEQDDGKMTWGLLYWWFKRNAGFYYEVMFRICVTHYVDLFLDIQTLYVFYVRHEFNYFSVNLMGIVFANLYSFYTMFNTPHLDGSAKETLLIGFLAPSGLHIAYLCYQSLRQGEVHKLLLGRDLAEVCIEAFVSALVQTYALVFTSWSDADFVTFSLFGWHQFRIPSATLVLLSVCSSMVSISSFMTGFDLRHKGFNGLPGRVTWNGLVSKLDGALVFLCRVTEVTSRITTLAIFCICTRQAFTVPEFVPEPARSWLSWGLITGGPLLLLADVLVLLGLISWSQWEKNIEDKWAYAFPSVLCLMNPLLERSNVWTIRAHIYWLWRAVELSLMASLAWCVQGTTGLQALLIDDFAVWSLACGCTVMWSLLLLVLRCWRASHVVAEYSTAMFSHHIFEGEEEALISSLFKVQEPSLVRRAQTLLQRQAQEEVLAKDRSDRTARSSVKFRVEGPGCFGSWVLKLQAWASNQVLEHAKSVDASQRLKRLVVISANIFHPLLASPAAIGSRRPYLEQWYLKVLQQIQDLAGSSQPIVLQHWEVILGVLLSWKGYTKANTTGCQLQSEKCRIVSLLSKICWKLRGQRFRVDSVKLWRCLLQDLDSGNLDLNLRKQLALTVMEMVEPSDDTLFVLPTNTDGGVAEPPEGWMELMELALGIVSTVLEAVFEDRSNTPDRGFDDELVKQCCEVLKKKSQDQMESVKRKVKQQALLRIANLEQNLKDLVSEDAIQRLGEKGIEEGLGASTADIRAFEQQFKWFQELAPRFESLNELAKDSWRRFQASRAKTFDALVQENAELQRDVWQLQRELWQAERERDETKQAFDEAYQENQALRGQLYRLYEQSEEIEPEASEAEAE